MGRILEIAVTLNALGGIATFLGFRYAARKGRERVSRAFRHGDEGEERRDVPPAP